jgi:tRNA(Ile2) C34 agmatinyltransferase TiaS
MELISFTVGIRLDKLEFRKLDYPLYCPRCERELAVSLYGFGYRCKKCDEMWGIVSTTTETP